jgi:hypothetical protein
MSENLGQVYARATQILSAQCNHTTAFCGGSADYYVDSSQEMIGKRPVYTARSKEYQIPNIFNSNRMNMPENTFNCKGPVWEWSCR